MSETHAFSGMPLHTVPAVVLDTETTGLDTKNDRIIEIAAVRIAKGGVLAHQFESFVAPGIPIPARSTEIHGIKDEDVAGAEPFRSVYPAFAEWIGSRIVIGYSVGFDLAMFKNEHERNGMTWTAPRALDVRHLVQVIAPPLPSDSLETTAEWLGVTISDRHRALGDASVTAQIFLALLPKLRERGIETVAQAERACRQLSPRLAQEAQAGWHQVAETARPAGAMELARIDSFPYRHRVSDVMHTPPLLVDAGTPLKTALGTMSGNKISSVFVGTGAAGTRTDILTERDVLRAIDAEGAAALDMPVSKFARGPLVSIGAEEFVYRAMTLMSTRNFRHLGVADETGALIGALSARDLLKQRAGDAMSLGDTIEAAATPKELGRVWAGLTVVTRALDAEGVDPRNTAAIISHELRALTRRAGELAEQQMMAEGMGPAPTPFALLVLGSGGRGESLLAMDQDNAIVFTEGAPGGNADKWFERLGSIVADTLNDAGVVYCKGGIMAKNPEWRMDLPHWRDAVGRWISGAKPEDILNSDIFFDAVTVMGERQLGDALHAEAMRVAKANKNFIKMMTDKASEFQNAIGWFGRVRTDEGRIDLKKSGIMPIFSAARVIALEHGIAARSTPARLEAARALDIRGAHLIGNLLDAHRILLGAILRQQLQDIDDGIPLSNKVEVATLDAHEKQELKWALSQSSSINDLMGTPARM